MLYDCGYISSPFEKAWAGEAAPKTMLEGKYDSEKVVYSQLKTVQIIFLFMLFSCLILLIQFHLDGAEIHLNQNRTI